MLSRTARAGAQWICPKAGCPREWFIGIDTDHCILPPNMTVGKFDQAVCKYIEYTTKEPAPIWKRKFVSGNFHLWLNGQYLHRPGLEEEYASANFVTGGGDGVSQFADSLITDEGKLFVDDIVRRGVSGGLMLGVGDKDLCSLAKYARDNQLLVGSFARGGFRDGELMCNTHFSVEYSVIIRKLY